MWCPPECWILHRSLERESEFLTPRRQTLKRRGNRKAQTTHLAGKARESVMFVKALGRVVLGIHHHCKHTELSTRGALQCVRQQNAAQSLALMGTVYSEPSKQHCRHHRIAGKLLGHFWRQRRESNACGGKRVIAGNFLGRDAHRHEAGGDASLDILRSLFPKIPVERIGAAGELRPVVVRGERLKCGTNLSLDDQGTMTLKGFLECRRRRGRTHEECCELLLRFP